MANYPHPVTHPSGWPRVRDLPARERQPFTKYLHGQTVPLVDGEPDEDQDFFYPHDYLDWKFRSRGPVAWD